MMLTAATAVVRRRLYPGDFSGAFADSAVLFPLLLALAWQTGASAAIMLVTTGIAYLATGWLFRLPIPVQPLKSLSIVAIAAGVSLAELQVAALLLGAIYLSISFMQVDRVAARVPDVLVHGFQLGLGVMLLLTALRLLGATPGELALVVAAGAGVIVLTRLTGLPLLGAIAVAGLLWGIGHAEPIAAAGAADHGLRTMVIGMMVVPQIALTLTNSVLGTERAARAYYGRDAWRVTPRRILTSLGVGNLVVGVVGGMPYCHGSGGVTAHYRGGSRTAGSNVIVGLALLSLAAVLIAGGGGLPDFPVVLQALLLGVIGVFHLQLSRPSWQHLDTAAILVIMGLAALLFQTMLAVLIAGIVALGIRYLLLPVRRAEPPREDAAASVPPGSGPDVRSDTLVHRPRDGQPWTG